MIVKGLYSTQIGWSECVCDCNAYTSPNSISTPRGLAGRQETPFSKVLVLLGLLVLLRMVQTMGASYDTVLNPSYCAVSPTRALPNPVYDLQFIIEPHQVLVLPVLIVLSFSQ